MKKISVGGIVRTLSAVLSEAVARKKIIVNPALRPGRYMKSAGKAAWEKAEADPFSRDEAKLLLATAKEHFPEWHPLLLCAVHTGMRPGELFALQWGDVTWVGKHPSISVRRSLHHRTRQTTTPKTRKGRREIDLSGQLRTALYLLKRRQRAEAFQSGKPRPEWIFTNSTGGPMDISKVRKIFLRVLGKAGLRHRSLYNPRDTFATLRIEQNEPLAYIRDQMGHSSIKMTVDTYSKWFRGANRDAVDRLFGDVAPAQATAPALPQAKAS